MTKQEIIELYLNRSGVAHKDKNRIELYQTLIDLAEQHSFPELKACFQGFLAWVKKDYEQALSYFQEATRLDEALLYPWNGLGHVYHDLKQFDQAKQCYEKAIGLDGTYAPPWNGLGIMYKSLKEYDKAKECFQKSIKLDGTFAYPWNGLGNVYFDLMEYSQARECYEKAIELDGTDGYPWNGLGNVYLALKEYDQAKECFDKAIELDPDEPGFWFNIGLLYYKQKKYKEAKGHLKVAHEGLKKIEYQDAYYLARTQDLLNEITDRLNAKKYRQDAKKYLKELQEQAAPEAETTSRLTKILQETQEVDLDVQDKLQKRPDYLQFIIEPSDRGKETPEEQKTPAAPEDYLLVLKRWNSYTPIVADSYLIGKGGGYFLKVNGKGIVIDPGFNFIDNFRGEGHLFHEIDAVIVSHAHNDHTADLESIVTLLHKYNEEIMCSPDLAKEDTIRRKLAREKKVDEEDITKEETRRAFLLSGRRKVIDFYLTPSVFKKYNGLFELSSNNDYEVHIVEPKDCKYLFDGVKAGGVEVRFLEAKHHDVISDHHSVGFYCLFPYDLVFIYSGDTGWDDRIEEQYRELRREFSQNYKLLLANLGGVKKQEQTYSESATDNSKAFYPNHLGRLGLARLIEVLKPEVCIISEFGEELGKWRQKLAEVFQKAFPQESLFLSGDIGLKFMLQTRTVRAIDKVFMSEKKLEEAAIPPESVVSYFLNKDRSLRYYNKKANFREGELVEILLDQIGHSASKATRTKSKQE